MTQWAMDVWRGHRDAGRATTLVVAAVDAAIGVRGWWRAVSLRHWVATGRLDTRIPRGGW